MIFRVFCRNRCASRDDIGTVSATDPICANMTWQTCAPNNNADDASLPSTPIRIYL